MCENLRSSIRQRPEVVVAMIRELAPDALGQSNMEPDSEETVSLQEELAEARKIIESRDAKIQELVEELSLKNSKAAEGKPQKANGADLEGLKDFTLRLAVNIASGGRYSVSKQDIELLGRMCGC